MNEPKRERILYCNCSYAQIIEPEVKGEVLRRLAASDADFEAVPDLCEMSARKDPLLGQMQARGSWKIAACYPRAVKWLFAAAAAPLADDTMVYNMREESAAKIVDGLLGNAAGSGFRLKDLPAPAAAEGARDTQSKETQA